MVGPLQVPRGRVSSRPWGIRASSRRSPRTEPERSLPPAATSTGPVRSRPPASRSGTARAGRRSAREFPTGTTTPSMPSPCSAAISMPAGRSRAPGGPARAAWHAGTDRRGPPSAAASSVTCSHSLRSGVTSTPAAASPAPAGRRQQRRALERLELVGARQRRRTAPSWARLSTRRQRLYAGGSLHHCRRRRRRATSRKLGRRRPGRRSAAAQQRVTPRGDDGDGCARRRLHHRGGAAATNPRELERHDLVGARHGLDERRQRPATSPAASLRRRRVRQASGVTARADARWDGTSWSALGKRTACNFCRPLVGGLTTIGTDLYVGGNFEPPAPPRRTASPSGTASRGRRSAAASHQWYLCGPDAVHAIDRRPGTDLYVGGISHCRRQSRPASSVWHKCGNGVVDAAGAVRRRQHGDGDCCSSTCHIEAGGGSCPDDGNPARRPVRRQPAAALIPPTPSHVATGPIATAPTSAAPEPHSPGDPCPGPTATPTAPSRATRRRQLLGADPNGSACTDGIYCNGADNAAPARAPSTPATRARARTATATAPRRATRPPTPAPRRSQRLGLQRRPLLQRRRHLRRRRVQSTPAIPAPAGPSARTPATRRATTASIAGRRRARATATSAPTTIATAAARACTRTTRPPATTGSSATAPTPAAAARATTMTAILAPAARPAATSATSRRATASARWARSAAPRRGRATSPRPATVRARAAPSMAPRPAERRATMATRVRPAISATAVASAPVRTPATTAARRTPRRAAQGSTATAACTTTTPAV